MADVATQLPARTIRSQITPSASRRFGPFETSAERLGHELDRRFGRLSGRDLFRAPQRSVSEETASFPLHMIVAHGLPAVDVTERDGEDEILAEMPGLGETEIEVRISDNVLTITGERKGVRDERSGEYHLMERHSGSILRSFDLPKEIDRDGIEASLSKGVLTLRLPRTAESVAQAKRIDVEAA